MYVYIEVVLHLRECVHVIIHYYYYYDYDFENKNV
jgi:hypothetical protein